jgi:hypothetical protein
VNPNAVDPQAGPASRPLELKTEAQIQAQLAEAIARKDGLSGAHCIHELWMRGEFSQRLEPALARLWDVAAPSIPDWLPMQYVEWLPLVYEVTARFQATGRGRTNLYLVLLDYRDSRPDPFGIYVGMSRYAPAQRFDQHKAGIRSSGAVLRRGLEVLTGPAQHLQRIPRAQAAQIEVALGEALTAAGLFVKGGH